MFYLLSTYWLALLLGGENADGKLRGGLKPQNIDEGLHRFGEAATCDLLWHSRSIGGQGTLLGVYRWLVLSLIAYILAHWAYLSTATTDLPDWGQAELMALESILPQLLVFLLLVELERMIPLARSHGFDIHISRCKI